MLVIGLIELVISILLYKTMLCRQSDKKPSAQEAEEGKPVP